MKVTMTTSKKYDEVNQLMTMTDEEYWEAYPDEKPEEPIVVEEEPEEGQTGDTDID